MSTPPIAQDSKALHSLLLPSSNIGHSFDNALNKIVSGCSSGGEGDRDRETFPKSQGPPQLFPIRLCQAPVQALTTSPRVVSPSLTLWNLEISYCCERFSGRPPLVYNALQMVNRYTLINWLIIVQGCLLTVDHRSVVVLDTWLDLD